MKLPTFLLIGMQKCGTGWLWRMIRQHPDVFVPDEKELHFFNKTDRYSRGIEWYRKQFAGQSGQRAVGESTPNYFWTNQSEHERRQSRRPRDVAHLVHKHLPDAKLIITLRNPTDRAISAYYHHIRARRVSPWQRLSDVKDQFGILSMGFYDKHLAHWRQYFPQEQILTLLFEEDILENKERTISKIYRFLDVDPSFEPGNVYQKYNTRHGHLHMRLRYSFPTVAKAMGRILPDAVLDLDVPRIPVHEHERAELQSIYRPHNQMLSDMIERPLPWLA